MSDPFWLRFHGFGQSKHQPESHCLRIRGIGDCYSNPRTVRALALKILKEAKELSKDSPFLFPSPSNENSHITEPAIDRAIRNNRELFDIDHFVPHDLRRTVASQITAMGIPRLTVSKILNHVESRVTAVYDRHSYDKEKQKALDKWSKRLEKIVKASI